MERKTLYALLVALIVVQIFAFKLDRLDRACLWRVICYRRYFGDGSTLKHRLNFICKFLLVPFRDHTYFAHFTGGGIYGAFVYDAHLELARRMNSKLFWNAFCAHHDILHPTLMAINKHGTLNVLIPLDPNELYIRKSDSGMGGTDVIKVKGSEVSAVPGANWIVQRLLRDCSGMARTFRFVSLHDGTRFVVWDLSKTGTTSNFQEGRTGGTVRLCKHEMCAALTHDEQLNLMFLMERLASLHVAEFGQIFSIGWDLMIDCPTQQSYLLEGNVCHATWFYPVDVPAGLIDDFKNRCRLFNGIQTRS